MKNLRGPLLILLSSLLFSTTGTLQQVAPAGNTPIVITEIRMLLGAITLFLWCFFTKQFPFNMKKVAWKALFTAVIAVLLYQIFFFSSVGKLGVAVGSVISIATTPIWAAIIAFLLYKSKPSFFWTIATFLAIIGVVLINSAGTSSGEAIGWALLLPILAGLSYAVEIIFIGQVVKNISPENAMLLEMSFVSLLLLPVIFFYPLDWIFTTQGILVSLGLGVITAGIAFPCFVGGLKLTSPIVAATLALTEPLMATALGIFFLHEPITMNMSIGIVCLISAVAVLVFENKKG